MVLYYLELFVFCACVAYTKQIFVLTCTFIKIWRLFEYFLPLLSFKFILKGALFWIFVSSWAIVLLNLKFVIFFLITAAKEEIHLRFIIYNLPWSICLRFLLCKLLHLLLNFAFFCDFIAILCSLYIIKFKLTQVSGIYHVENFQIDP